jgi:hypothetical protein
MINITDANTAKVNELILEKLKGYPRPVAELATIAIQLSEDLPADTVFEMLQTTIRDVVSRTEEDS